MGNRTTLLQRFERKFERLGEDACWPWRANKNNRGYGLIRPGGLAPKQLAHRVSYELFVGPLPVTALVLHACDNPCCVNPKHLFVGTHKANYDDMVQKGRRRVVVNPDNKPPTHSGDDHPRAKLSSATVALAREMHASGASLHSLSAKFGVNRSTMRNAVRGKTWPGSRGPLGTRKSAPKGSTHTNSKLTDAIVRQARDRFAAGEPCYRLAKEFGVSPSVMQDAVMHRSWKHVP
jgi:transposase